MNSYGKHRRMDVFSHRVETLGVNSYAKHKRMDVGRKTGRDSYAIHRRMDVFSHGVKHRA